MLYEFHIYARKIFSEHKRKTKTIKTLDSIQPKPLFTPTHLITSIMDSQVFKCTHNGPVELGKLQILLNTLRYPQKASVFAFDIKILLHWNKSMTGWGRNRNKSRTIWVDFNTVTSLLTSSNEAEGDGFTSICKLLLEMKIELINFWASLFCSVSFKVDLFVMFCVELG